MSCIKRVTKRVIEKLQAVCEDAYDDYAKSDDELISLKDEAASYGLVFTYLKSDISVYMAFYRKNKMPIAEMSRCTQEGYGDIFRIVNSLMGGHCFWGEDGIVLRPVVDDIFISRSSSTVSVEGSNIVIFSSDGGYYAGHSAKKYIECYMRPANVDVLYSLLGKSGLPMIKVGIGRLPKIKRYSNIRYIFLPIKR